MAKVTAPLWSGTARGQIYKALVFFPWKGIPAVRSYVIPANPQSGPQQQQRGYLRDSIAEWRSAGFSSDDLAAWDRAANYAPKPMTGFNMFTSRYLKVRVSGMTWQSGKNVAIDNSVAKQLTIEITVANSNTPVPTLYYGTSPTSMPNSKDMTWDDGKKIWKATLDNLGSGVHYYMWFSIANFDKAGSTGIYHAVTT